MRLSVPSAALSVPWSALMPGERAGRGPVFAAAADTDETVEGRALMGGLRTELIHEEERLFALRDDWWDLWERTDTTPFQSPAWCIPWWQVFRPGRLCTAVCRAGDRLVGLAALYRESGAGPARVLPVGIALGDYLDILVDPRHPAAGEALLERLQADDEWEVCSLEELQSSAVALRIGTPPGCREQREQQSAAPVLPLPTSLEQLRTVVPASKLRNLRNARRRAQRRGELQIESVDAGGAAQFLETLFGLHRARWNSRGAPGIVSDDLVRRFHRIAIPYFVDRGVARLFQVRIAGTIAAAYYGFCHHGRAYAYLSGFDPSLSFESPGTLVVGHAIETAVTEGCQEFHFLRGQEPYKYLWGATDRWTWRRTFVRETADV